MENLTVQDQIFVDQCLRHGNVLRAYSVAYQTVEDPQITGPEAYRTFARLRPHISQLEKEQEAAAAVTPGWVITRLKRVVERCMQEEPVYNMAGEPTGLYKFDGSTATRALELLGKTHAMFTDRKEVEAVGLNDVYEIYERARARSLELRRALPPVEEATYEEVPAE